MNNLVTSDVLEGYLKEVDSNGDGELDFAEF
jgi:Ca2+-binding EF-hand superfamily protein